MSIIAISILNAISLGLLLFLLSAGLTLIFSMMGVLNFSHAGFYMLGAYAAYSLGAKVGFFGALMLSPILLGAGGMLIERYGLRKLHLHGHVAELLFTFGLSYVIEEVVRMIWGNAPVNYGPPASLAGTAFSLWGTAFPAYRAFIMVLAMVVLLALYLAITRTRVGLIIQAALTHAHMVEALGHDVPRIFMWVFGIGAALAGLAGSVAAPVAVTEPAMAGAVGPIVFVVIVLGGIGSLSGAFVASILVGLVQTFAVLVELSPYKLAMRFLDPALASVFDAEIFRISLAQLAPVLPFLIMVVMLVVRPNGILGKKGAGHA